MSTFSSKVLSMMPLRISTPELRKILQLAINETEEKHTDMSPEELIGQFRILLKKLDTPSKLGSLHNKMHRAVVVEMICCKGMQFYNYSYFNRAKLSHRHLELLQEVGPILFAEGVMIVSKMNLIYKNHSRILI